MSWLYVRMTDLLARAGWPRAPHRTPLEYLGELRPHFAGPLAPAATLVEAITDRFLRARYGRGDVSASELDDSRAALTDLERMLRGVKGEQPRA
jgi:hypothetical protein